MHSGTVCISLDFGQIEIVLASTAPLCSCNWRCQGQGAGPIQLRSGSNNKLSWIDCHALGCIVCFVDPNKPVRQLEHVVPQADDDELRVLGSLLDVVCHNGDVLEICHMHWMGWTQALASRQQYRKGHGI